MKEVSWRLKLAFSGGRGVTAGMVHGGAVSTWRATVKSPNQSLSGGRPFPRGWLRLTLARLLNPTWFPCSGGARIENPPNLCLGLDTGNHFRAREIDVVGGEGTQGNQIAYSSRPILSMCRPDLSSRPPTHPSQGRGLTSPGHGTWQPSRDPGATVSGSAPS